MNKTQLKLFMDLLEEIPDHRHGNAIQHKITDIIVITLLALLCNANTLTGIERFGQAHEKELREILELPKGIPSHDTFGDVLSRIDFSAVNEVFHKWLGYMRGTQKAKSIAIDGKTVRKSGSALHKAAHIVTAYASDLQLILGEVVTEEKSNEITAIPALLETLDIKGSTVTIDAMGTQTEIAKKIIDKDGDYILALKENQASLYEDARYLFEQDYENRSKHELAQADRYAITYDKGHGRIEKRACWIMRDDEEDIHQLRRADACEKLHGIAVIRSTRTENGTTSTTDRYYLFSDQRMTASKLLQLQRNHWRIENNLHWTLDVVLKEDDHHARVEHIAIVMDMLRKLVLQLLKHDTTLKGSMAGKREICAWRFDLALTLLRNARIS